MTQLTMIETSRVLRTSRQTVARLVARGDLVAVKGSGRTSPVLVDADSLQAYIERNTVGGTP